MRPDQHFIVMRFFSIGGPEIVRTLANFLQQND
jgi:hypothetical protein